jgi:hypothetical protein
MRIANRTNSSAGRRFPGVLRGIVPTIAGLLISPGVFASAVCLNEVDSDRYTLSEQALGLANPIMFVSQMPLARDMETRMSAFGNHQGSTEAAGRGGDLFILYPASPDSPHGCLRNLTRELGLGEPGVLQGDQSIAVRDPAISHDATCALFSMVQGAPLDSGNQETSREFYWQIHEVCGLDADDTPRITRLAGQPDNQNNIAPIYATDSVNTVLFVSDKVPRDSAARHLYPRLDEYELLPTTTGLWSLDRTTEAVELLLDTPSGAFTPLTDSCGRTLVSSWDHLQSDIYTFGTNGRHSWNLTDESADAPFAEQFEYFPSPIDHADPRVLSIHPEYGQLKTHKIKLFFLWELKDIRAFNGQVHTRLGGAETINHIGRHQLDFFFEPSFIRAQSGLSDFSHPFGRARSLEDGIMYAAEDPTEAGTFFFTDAQHFQKNGAGRLLKIRARCTASAEGAFPVGITPRDVDRLGAYRDPLPLSDGQLVAVYTATEADTRDAGSAAGGVFTTQPNYVFSLVSMVPQGDIYEPGAPLVSGIGRHVELFGVHFANRTSYDGAFSLIDPVEVRPRNPVAPHSIGLPATVETAFAQAGVSAGEFVDWLRERELAVLVVNNVTSRNADDEQQPYNLLADTERGLGAASIKASRPTPVWPVRYLQIFEGVARRVNGFFGGADGTAPSIPPVDLVAGRRVVASPYADATGLSDVATSAVGRDPALRPASVRIALDGSVAAVVPAGRAFSYQLTDAAGFPIVTERVWLTARPGEIVACGSCHAPDTVDQAGREQQTNVPIALTELLGRYKAELGEIFFNGFE